MKRLFGLAFGLLIAGFVCLAQAQMMPLTGAGGKFKATVVATGSAWDASGKGTGITLSTTAISNDTAANSAGGSWSTVRGTQCYAPGVWKVDV
jgi:hypothetical protein